MENEIKESKLVLSVMLGVTDASTAVAWYQKALGANILWSLGSVAGMEIDGAAFFVGEPANKDGRVPKNWALHLHG